MSVPVQVQRQSAAALKLMQDLSEDPNAPNEPVGSDEGSPPEADSEAERTPPPDRPEQPTGTTDNFEQKYRTLQGMFNAEQARTRSEVLQQQQRIAQLETLLSQVTSQPQATTDTPSTFVTEQDRAEYSESLDVMRRVSKEEVAPIVNRLTAIEQTLRALQTNVVPRIEQVASRQAQTAEQRFWQDIATLVPDWQVINADSGWLGWLAAVDPLTGLSRQALLEDARMSLDANRVAAIFSAWKGQNGHDAQPTRGVTASQLEKQEVPGRSRGGQPPVVPQPKTITTQDIEKFYADVRKGAYQGREAERARIEKEIFDAAAGRSG